MSLEHLSLLAFSPVKYLLIALGLLCVALGTLGVFFPVLPTTPFLLAATFLFARSSEKLNQWLLNHKWFGPYLYNYRMGLMTRTHKIRTLALMWVGLIFSAILIGKPIMWAVFAVIGIGVSIHISMLGRVAK